LPKSLKEWLKGLFRNPCQKLISYQETTWKFSASVDADKSVTVDLGLEKQVQEVTPATNHAKLLDDFQYLLCKEIERWTEDVNYVSLLSKYRIMAIAYIVCLSQILEDIKVDPTNKALKQELVRISKSMTRLTEDFGNAVRYLT
jgi:hypothetical protein